MHDTRKTPSLKALWKKILPVAATGFCLFAAGTAVARYYASDSCCKPGASCCYPGSPCCAHAHEPVSQR